MRHLRFALWALFLLVSLAAHADSISVFQITFAHIGLDPEAEAMTFEFTGPGIGISGLGSFECPSGWCGQHFVAAGTPMTFGIFENFGLDITIGGKTYSNPQAVLNAWTMSLSNALSVPDCCATAILNGSGLLSGSINTANGTLQFEIKVPVGTLGIDWVQSIEDPSFYTPWFTSSFFASSPTPVPEPGSVALLATGLAGILGTLKFKPRHQGAK